MSALLTLLLLVPFGAWYWSKRQLPAFVWASTGAALGAVISPLSLGLYVTSAISPIFISLGFIGLLSSLFHGAPGFHSCVWAGFIPRGTVVERASHIPVDVANGLLWGLVYCALGAAVDRLRRARAAI
jgi:hypothetical protein